MEPDCILVEGPPDAQAVIPLLADAQMQPPVAMLVYVPDRPVQSVYYPLAVYSPEWQALGYALEKQVPVRFMDLPICHQFAMNSAGPDTEPAPGMEPPQVGAAPADNASAAGAIEAGEPPVEAEPPDASSPDVRVTDAEMRHDPLTWLAKSAGYGDGETWWEQMVEQRLNDADLFRAVQEAMTALRESLPPIGDPIEPMREAWMRQTLRAAIKEGYTRIAVVCGAWHVPALAELPSAKSDAALLKGLPRVKTAATWVPWTYGRLTSASGYGAGVSSPAWYDHLWHRPGCASIHWISSAAALLRAEDLPASTASVIEAVRLADALAAVRDRPVAGLAELTEAAQSVFCFGSDVPMRLIRERLIVGERLGRVPDATPMLPIQQDLRREQKRLRLQPDASHADKDLDLRNGTDLERSVLLHRLRLLEIPWGVTPQEAGLRTAPAANTLSGGGSGGDKGTFHERWRLQWRPEFEVSLIEANRFGNTIASAAGRVALESAEKLNLLAEMTKLLETALLAGLQDAMPALMERLENMAALTSDVPHLMDALVPLAGILRYGNVRNTDSTMVRHAFDGLGTRIYVGLPSACASLNDDAAAEMWQKIAAVNESLRLLRLSEHQTQWQSALSRLAGSDLVHGLIEGQCCRILFDQGIWTQEQIGGRMALVLSTAVSPDRAAAWIDGLLRNSGELLVHTDSLWPLIDRWIADLTEASFPQLLPLLRRTFSSFPPALRRQIGERARHGVREAAHGSDASIDQERGRRVLPTLALILGVPWPAKTSGAVTETAAFPTGEKR